MKVRYQAVERSPSLGHYQSCYSQKNQICRDKSIEADLVLGNASDIPQNSLEKADYHFGFLMDVDERKLFNFHRGKGIEVRVGGGKSA